MREFYRDYCAEKSKGIEFLAVEKRFYQYEEISGDLYDRNMIELAHFYRMCGNRRFMSNMEVSQEPTVERFVQIRQKYQFDSLPYHNAVAFFRGFMELDSLLPRDVIYFMLAHLLPYILPCHGFVFGSIFYTAGLYCIHPCDLDYIILLFPDKTEAEGVVLRSQAELRVGRTFMKEKLFYGRLIARLSHQRER